MITEEGKRILAKYLIGQAPAYASYIAVGCGAKPLGTNQSFDLNSYRQKTALDFEMFRVPIVSRGYVNENNVEKIVLTAELPTDERYEISEVGVYSAGANPSAGAYDSRSLFAFTVNENWEYHDQTSATALPVVYEPLDGSANDNAINQTYSAFQTNSDNTALADENRVARYERARFFNNIVMLRGDSANLSVGVADGKQYLIPSLTSNHLHLLGTSLDFNKNAPNDQIKLAFSVINKNPSSLIVPDSIRILVEFAENDVNGTGQSATFNVIMDNGTGAGQYDFATNRYYVITKELQELKKTTGFTWNNVSIIKIYASVLDGSSPSPDFYIGLDAIRFENVSTSNPVYGLTGYTVLKNTNAETVVKEANTTNYIEFRFAMDVQ